MRSLHLFFLYAALVNSFTIHRRVSNSVVQLRSTVENPSTIQPVSNDVENVSIDQARTALLDLLPRMTGKEEEFRMVELYVNRLEELYVAPQTLDFLNLAMGGTWQLLFSTTLRRGTKANFRLRELTQKVQPKGLKGCITNLATWDTIEEGSVFDISGSFSVKCSYSINQGARMVVDLDGHALELAKGSKLPKDFKAIVGALSRAMPNELFDPNEHALDTTYLDGDLRIVRMTGPRFEGVRDIFIRQGSIEINPE